MRPGFGERFPERFGTVAGCRLLVGGVDDLNPPILPRERLGWIFQVGFAVARRYQVARVDAVLLQQETLDRLGSALGQTLIVGLAALPIGIASDDEGAASHA